MTDFSAFILSKFAKIIVMIFGLILLPWSIFIAIKESRLNSYWYEVSRAWDILANKIYEPALNGKMGIGFGQDETISQCMARNKSDKTNTSTADWWEKRINFFDKDHLEKTSKSKK